MLKKQSLHLSKNISKASDNGLILLPCGVRKMIFGLVEHSKATYVVNLQQKIDYEDLWGKYEESLQFKRPYIATSADLDKSKALI